MLKQMQAFPETVGRMKNLHSAKCPCTVISVEFRWWPTEKENDDFRLSRQELAESCGTQLIVAEGSGHNVPRQTLALVVSVIIDIATK